MKKIAIGLVLLVIVALPFVFANNSAQHLEEKGYSATIDEKAEVYFDTQCQDNGCGLKSGVVEQIN